MFTPGQGMYAITASSLGLHNKQQLLPLLTLRLLRPKCQLTYPSSGSSERM